MIQHDKLTDFELIIRRVKHLSHDEKIALAKYLARTEGILMFTPGDVQKIVENRVQAELAEQKGKIMIARLGD